MPPTDLQKAVLDHVQHPNYRPVKLKVIAKKLGLTHDGKKELRKIVRKLSKRGQLAYGADHLVLPMATNVKPPREAPDATPVASTDASPSSDEQPRPIAPKKAKPSPKTKAKSPAKVVLTPKSKPHKAKSSTKAKPGAESPASTTGDADLIVGEFRRMEAGYGFFRPASALSARDRSSDIYVAAKNAADAASGDTVSIRVRKSTRHGGRRGPEGEIVEVLERETNCFVGTYFEIGDLGMVQVDGRVFAQPVLVGDARAKRARVNDKVVFEMVRFPTHTHDGEGVIVEVLGAHNAPGIDTLSIVHEFNLPGEFPDDVIDDARRQAEQFDESIGPDRTDLTAETVVTIDPETARDFDDAISLKRIEGGHWQLGVHIADVSHFVELRTPLDREARDRATSVYLPDTVIPMLPEIISNNLASLQPDRVRYTMTALLEMTDEGIPVDTQVMTAAIRSDRRFTYEEIDDYLADREPWKEKLTPEVHALVADMHTLAMRLRGRRKERGSLELTMPDVTVDLDDEGRVTGAHVEENNEIHQMIEEFMLAANEAVAEHLRAAKTNFLRRIHDAPDPRKLVALTEFVEQLGFRTESLESRFAIQDLLAVVVNTPQQHAVNYAVLRSMKKAVYSPEPEGHFALASDCYCHFTSPIRRYPDLTVHRMLKQLIAGRKPAETVGEQISLGSHCSQREQRAEQAERELTKVKLLSYLAGRIGEEMDGVITGVEEFGLFIRGTELPAEGFVHVTALGDDYYRFDRRSHSLEGNREGNRYRLGDTVRVSIARVDVPRRELDLKVLGQGPPKPRSKKAKSKPKAKPKDKRRGRRR